MALTAYLNQTVTHYGRATYDAYARETDEATTTDYSCRFQEVTKRQMLSSGEIMTVDAFCFINEDPDIEIDDRLDYESVKYRVHGIKKNIDGQGNVHHVTLTLTKWSN